MKENLNINGKRLKDLALSDVAYIISAEYIEPCFIERINKYYNDIVGITISFNSGTREYKGSKDGTEAQYEYNDNYWNGCLYSNLEAAENAQRELRRTALENAKKEMLAAQEKYFNIVEKYKAICVSKPSEVMKY